MISIRNVQCDFYLATLNGFNRPALLERHPQLSPKTRVPVIRIFGPLPTGSFVCISPVAMKSCFSKSP
jgi:hypothetical protein